MPKTSTAVALGLVFLLLAVSIPAAITVTNEPAQATFDIDDEASATVTQTLQVLIDDTTTSDATITLRDTAVVDSDTQTLTEGETAQYEVRDETMNVTLRELQGANANATVAVEYSRTYGWHPGTKVLVENLPLVLVIVGLVVVGGGLGAAVKR